MNAGEDVEKREPSYTVGGNVSWGSHYRKWYGGSSKKNNKKLKIDLLYVPAVQPLGIYPDKTVIQKDTYTPMLTSSATSSSQERETTCVH